MKSNLWCLLGLLAAVSGCDDPLKSVDRIEEPRVLGARIEVEGDPGRASPVPGETVHLRWLVATPRGDSASGMSLVACSARAQNSGIASCGSAPFASAGTEPASEPRFEFVVPAELDAEQNPHLLVHGRLCPAATGSVRGERTGCSDGEGLRVSVDFALDRADDRNTNPTLPGDALSFDGAPWPALPVPADGCQGLGLPEISQTSGEHAISIELPATARDELVQTSSADPPREALQLAHFVSAGELDHAFNNILPADTELRSAVRFDPVLQADASGTLVRFWFVVRDWRGGSDFTERALCVLP